ncbi:MAG: hypothetical protein GX220_00495 [Treponema sp.]|jgi:endo-1,4-beta-D-glucanase Y|nr:hypothetical protein [Treponema sp.]
MKRFINILIILAISFSFYACKLDIILPAKAEKISITKKGKIIDSYSTIRVFEGESFELIVKIIPENAEDKTIILNYA